MIYDCFTFFNELDLLEIRLNVLNDVVDKFVLVESTRTHQGKPKELYYEQNKQRFAAFSHKIIHVVGDEFPAGISDSWEYERLQRNEIAKGLKECKPDDVILVSDLDEIPNPEKVKEVSRVKGWKIFRQSIYCYYLNCAQEGSRYWIGTAMARFDEFDRPQDLRNEVIRDARLVNRKAIKRAAHLSVLFFRNFFIKHPITIVDNGGWHFTYMGGAKKIIQKIEAFAHTEHNIPQNKEEKKLEELLQSGVNIYDGTKLAFVPIDNTFPIYLRENQQKFADYIRKID